MRRATGTLVRRDDLPALPSTAGSAAEDPLAGTWAEIERRAILAALARTGGNKSEAARLLGLARSTFLDKLRRADIAIGASEPPSAGEVQ